MSAEPLTREIVINSIVDPDQSNDREPYSNNREPYEAYKEEKDSFNIEESSQLYIDEKEIQSETSITKKILFYWVFTFVMLTCLAVFISANMRLMFQKYEGGEW